MQYYKFALYEWGVLDNQEYKGETKTEWKKTIIPTIKSILCVCVWVDLSSLNAFKSRTGGQQ